MPVEFLHTLNAFGLPIAHLRLKLGCPVLLLRNIDAKHGLCNGTRATNIRMTNRLLEVQLITGDHAGEIALIPRITLSPTTTGADFAITLSRRQSRLTRVGHDGQQSTMPDFTARCDRASQTSVRSRSTVCSFM